MMKKLLSICVLFVLSAFVLIQVFPAKAVPNILYRCRFLPINPPCANRGRFYPGGVDRNYQDMDMTGNTTYTIPINGAIEIDLNWSCCGKTPQLGWTWEESSTDGGNNWTLVAPTFVPLNEPLGYRVTEWDNDTGVLGDPLLHESCP